MTRLNYDHIAPGYDSQPYRAKTVHPDLLTLIDECPQAALRLLDVGCGTGNQLIANHQHAPHLLVAGVDFSTGMLSQARAKAPHLPWLRADGAALPFRTATFDFVTSQFMLHHTPNKIGLLRELARMLRPDGRLIYENLCPFDMPNWIYYQYFPTCFALDQRDFLPTAAITTALETAGCSVNITHMHLQRQTNLSAWRAVVQRRDTCSQLNTIAAADYQTGLAGIDRDLAAGIETVDDEICLVKIVARRRP